MPFAQQWLVQGYMQWLRYTAWRKFCKQAEDPKHTQQQVLHKILHRHQSTVIGQNYGFATLDVDSYRAKVPIHDYEALRALIDQQATGEQTLTYDMPIHYLMTSGTTGKPKTIPLTKTAKRELRSCQKLASYGYYRQTPTLFSGKMMGMAADATEGLTPLGIPYGSMSGVLQNSMSRFMYRRSLLSEAVTGQSRYESLARKALGEKDISVAITANPSTLLRLKEEMIAKGLAKDNVRLGDLWPSIRGLITWTHGNCSSYIPALQQEFPKAYIQEMGYMASELYGTIPTGNGECAPTLGQYFFEFAPINAWDAGDGSTLLLHELKVGNRYYLIVTSNSGLYRYFMDDIVEVNGWFNDTPCLRFVQKGKDVTSLTGEKLYENQLILAMESIWQKQDMPKFFLALAHDNPAHYRLYIEDIQHSELRAQQLDQALAATNIEYKAKRDSGRLRPLQLTVLKPGAGTAYRNHLARNQREAQLKLRRLGYAKDCDFDFNPFLVDAS